MIQSLRRCARHHAKSAAGNNLHLVIENNEGKGWYTTMVYAGNTNKQGCSDRGCIEYVCGRRRRGRKFVCVWRDNVILYVYSWHSGKLKQALFFHVNIPVEGYFFKLTKNVAITVSGAFNNLYTVSCNALCSFTLNTLFVQTSQQSRHPCHNRIPNQQDFPPKPAVLRPVRIRSYLFLTPCALRLHSLQPQVESTS